MSRNLDPSKMELENGFSPLPDFLKIYNSQEMSQKLVLFSDYRKYYPTHLPQTAVLKKPDGTFWTVKWKITQEEVITFEDGWNKLVKDNGLIDGDYLLFTYDGSRNFWIRIYRNGLILKSGAPAKVEEISDDEDNEKTGEDDGDDDDSQENTVISLSLGSDDKDGDDEDDDDADYDGDEVDYDNDIEDDDDDDTAVCEVTKAFGKSNRRVSTKKSRGASSDDPTKYLDDPSNPFFITTSTSAKMAVAKQVIRDYELKFGRTVKLIDRFGKTKTNVGKWSDRVVVKKWDKIYKRNKVKPQDLVVCEILRRNNVVRYIKAHFIKR